MPSCVIVVENLPVPLDRRVWQEACALRDAGWTVSVICPKSQQFPAAFETIDDIEIFRHNLPLEASGKFAFLYEYAAALFSRVAPAPEGEPPPRLRRDPGVQSAGPHLPRRRALQALRQEVRLRPSRRLPGALVAKFERKGFFHSLLLMAEKATFRTPTS